MSIFDQSVYIYSDEGSVKEYQIYLPKGNYVFKHLSTNGQFVYSLLELIPTTFYGENNVVQNGQVVDYTYLLKDNISSLTLTEDSIFSAAFTLPINKEDTISNINFIIKDANGNEVANQYYSKSSENTDGVYSGNMLLAKGKYTVNIQLSTGAYDLNSNPKKNRYMFTITPASEFNMPTPFLKQKNEKYGLTSYKMTFNWEDSIHYDGLELWAKTDNGKWKVVDTATNSKYSRYTTGYAYYNIGTIAYYKIRAYKSGYGCKLYTDYSNVISMKKLSKPTVKYKVKKKAITVSYNSTSSINGYQVRYKLATSKKWKTKTISSAKSKSYTIKGVSKGKKYDVQVRSFKKIAKDKMYSSWTTKKTVKVK